MRSLVLVLSILSIISVIYCENNSYSKSCFVKFLLQVNQIDGKYKKYISKNEQPGEDCEQAVNQTLDAIRTSSKEPCILEFLNKKGVAEVLLRKFLMPQLDNGIERVTFNDQFTDFRKKVVDTSSVVCSNPRIFRPDVAKRMREAMSFKESKAREIKCLEIYIKHPNQVLTEDCRKVVDYARSDFYGRMQNEMKAAFAPPNDQLFDMDCSMEKALQVKLFERVYFFVILATTRNMTDKQIDTVAKNANIAINNSQKVIFECMN